MRARKTYAIGRDKRTPPLPQCTDDSGPGRGLQRGLEIAIFMPNSPSERRAFLRGRRLKEFCRAMNGYVRVNKDQRRLAEMSGRLSNDGEFGWGIFGKLNKGGMFSVRQEQVESGQWEVTFIDVHITGRAWFFNTIEDQRRESCGSFQRVPEGITLENAAVMMKQEARRWQ